MKINFSIATLAIAISACLVINAVQAKNQANTMIQKYGTLVTIQKNQTVQFEDGLSVTLRWFSHKRPYANGPSKATATMILGKDGKTEEFSLSEHGRAGIPRERDGLTDSERYDTKQWQSYEFQLKAFNYDEAIKLIVLKKVRK